MRLDMIATAAAGHSIEIYVEELARFSYTRTSYEHPRRTFIQAPAQRVGSQCAKYKQQAMEQ
jgi:hypothetical protein